MQPSIMQTLSVPALGGNNPSRLIQAGPIPLRVLVRNEGGVLVYLSHEAADLSSIGSTAGVYQLPVGQSDVIVLAPTQSLFAAANGGNGQICIASSEAIPVKSWMES